MIILSICIPVFNREKYIGHLLDKLLTQDNQNIEVVISDNASTDGTLTICKKFDNKFKNFKLFESTKNNGADWNYSNVAKIATGKYIWFMGSDENIANQSIEKIISCLKYNFDIVMLSHYICDINLIPYKVNHLLKNNSKNTFILNTSKDREMYLKKSKSLSSIFGYLSSIIVKKTSWNNTKIDDKYLNSLYSHTQRLFSIFFSDSKLFYIHEPLVYWRGGNDTFVGRSNLSKRYMIDIEGFSKIKKDFIKTNYHNYLINRIFKKHHKIFNILYLRSTINTLEKWDIFSSKLNDFGYNKYFLIAIRMKIVFFLLRIAAIFYKKVIKPLRIVFFGLFSSFKFKEIFK